MFDFAGRHVFVVGGTSGINLGIARGFARAGATVGVASRSQDKVDAAVETLTDAGPPAAGFAADVRDAERFGTALDDYAQGRAPIDVLVVGQAGNFPAPVTRMSPRGFEAVVDIDLNGSFNVVHAAHRHLRDSDASIVMISAPQAFVPMALQAHVCAAKAGVDMLTRVLALEWGARGVRVNGIVPGPIADTEGMRRLAPTPEMLERARASVPLGRLGTVDDIAHCALFLASPFASYVSGAIVPVDGGWSLGGAAELSRDLASAFERAARREKD